MILQELCQLRQQVLSFTQFLPHPAGVKTSEANRQRWICWESDATGLEVEATSLWLPECPAMVGTIHEVAMLSGRSWTFIIGNTAKATQQFLSLASVFVQRAMIARFIQSYTSTDALPCQSCLIDRITSMPITRECTMVRRIHESASASPLLILFVGVLSDICVKGAVFFGPSV